MQLELFPDLARMQPTRHSLFVPQFYSPSELEYFLNNLTIVEMGVAVLDKRVQKQAISENYRGLCPFHNEKTPSFYLRVHYDHYRCFGCNARGGPLLLDYNLGSAVIEEMLKKSRLPFVDLLKDTPPYDPPFADEQQRYFLILKNAFQNEIACFS